MVKLNYSELKFDHIVEFTGDRTTFAAARYNGNNHLRIFLIYENTGNVYTRNGTADSWEAITGTEAKDIRDQIERSRSNRIPVYKVNSVHTQ